MVAEAQLAIPDRSLHTKFVAARSRVAWHSRKAPDDETFVRDEESHMVVRRAAAVDTDRLLTLGVGTRDPGGYIQATERSSDPLGFLQKHDHTWAALVCRIRIGRLDDKEDDFSPNAAFHGMQMVAMVECRQAHRDDSDRFPNR